MDERELLLLGILMAQSQYGYRINEFIEQNLSRVTEMKKPTAYAILARLRDAGYVVEHTEQAGNRPQRKVYTITPAGKARFMALLRESLNQAGTPLLGGNVGLMFLHHLDSGEARAALRRRLDQVRAQIAEYEQVPVHSQYGVELALDRLRAHLRAEAAWLEQALARLES